MRITFLGTAAGAPEPNRKQSSVLLEAGKNRYIIDMGTQSAEQLITKGIDLSSVKGIFVSHMHCDHSNGLFSMMFLLSNYYKTADPEILLPEPIEEAVSVMKQWLRLNGTELRNMRFGPVRDGEIFNDGVLKVTAYKTMHTDMSFACLFEADGKRVLYTSDLFWSDPQKDFPFAAMEKGLDLAICEGVHFPATKYLPIFEGRSDIKKICITHYKNDRLIPVIEFMKTMSEIPVILAADGMELEL